MTKPLALPLLPLSALAAAVLFTIAFAAEAGIAFCDRRLAIVHLSAICGGHLFHASPAFADASSSAAQVFEICPIVLALGVVTAALSAWAIVRLRSDREAAHMFLSWLESVPVRSTALALTAASSVLVAAISARVPHAFDFVAGLIALAVAFATSLAATLLVTALARLSIDLARRIVVRLLLPALLARARVRPLLLRFRGAHTPRETIAFSTGGGLRAPPPLLH